MSILAEAKDLKHHSLESFIVDLTKRRSFVNYHDLTSHAQVIFSS